MGIYTVNNVMSESALDDIQVENSHLDISIASGYAIVAESEENYSMLMKAVGISELAYFEENGVEMQYEAGSLSGFFGKIKEFFIALYKKVKSLVQKFVATLDSFILKDKDFVKKYKSALLAVDLKDFEFKGYTFTCDALDVKTAYDAADKAIKDAGFEAVTSADDKSDMSKEKKALEDMTGAKATEFDDKLRGAVVGSNDAVESGDFATELFKKFRNGADEADTLTTFNVTNLMTIIEGAAQAKKEAEKDLKETKKVVDELVKKLTKIESEIEKKLPGDKDAAQNVKDNRAMMVKYVNKTYSLQRSALNFVTVMNSAKLTAIKAENRQSKAICVRMLGYKPKNEGAGVANEGGMLDGVVFK